jgi:hypothetical protein
MRDTFRHIFEITIVGVAVIATLVLVYAFVSMIWLLG